MANIFSRRGMETFRLDKRLVECGALKNLSGDALRLQIFASYGMYTRRKLNLSCSLEFLEEQTGLSLKRIHTAAQKLFDHELLKIRISRKGIVTFSIFDDLNIVPTPSPSTLTSTLPSE